MSARRRRAAARAPARERAGEGARHASAPHGPRRHHPATLVPRAPAGCRGGDAPREHVGGAARRACAWENGASLSPGRLGSSTRPPSRRRPPRTCAACARCPPACAFELMAPREANASGPTAARRSAPSAGGRAASAFALRNADMRSFEADRQAWRGTSREYADAGGADLAHKLADAADGLLKILRNALSAPPRRRRRRRARRPRPRRRGAARRGGCLPRGDACQAAQAAARVPGTPGEAVRVRGVDVRVPSV